MTIKTRLFALALAFALIASVITAMAIKTMEDNRNVIHAYTQASQNALRGERLNRYLVTIAVELRALYVAKSVEEARWRADRVDQNANKLEALVADWYTQVRPGEVPELDAISARLKSAMVGTHNLARLGRDVSSQAAEAAGNHDAYRVKREDMQTLMDSMITHLEARLKQTRESLDRFEQERIRQFALIAGGGIALLLTGAWWVAAGMAARLRKIRGSIVRISEGAYDTRLPDAAAGDEIGEIWGALDILKARAQEADRLTKEKLEKEQSLRELMLD